MTSSSDCEVWKPVTFDKNYEASNLGRIRSIPSTVKCGRGGSRVSRGQIITPWVIKNTGYLQVCLSGRKKYSVHRLVIHAFEGPPINERMECAHNNGVKTDNRIENLRWATKSSNMSDKKAHGTQQIGEINGFSKLTSEEVLEIRKDTRSNLKIAKSYGVSETAIASIKRGITWGWLQDKKDL